MSRFYVTKENISGNFIKIDGKEANHILNVMRLGENEKVTVFDGTGTVYTGFIKEARHKSVTVEIISKITPKRNRAPFIALAQAIPKKDKMDFIVEKATELGVSSVIPLVTERTIVNIEGEKKGSKVNRWRKIAGEASKQCGRTDVPEIRDIMKFSEFISGIDSFDLALMGCLQKDTIDLREAVDSFKSGKIIVFIGPEGDFAPNEIAAAKEKNCVLISLGNNVLKSDTAALFVMSVLGYEFLK